MLIVVAAAFFYFNLSCVVLPLVDLFQLQMLFKMSQCQIALQGIY